MTLRKLLACSVAAAVALFVTTPRADAQSCAGGAIPCLQALGFLPGAEARADRYSSAHAISADGNVVVGLAKTATGQDEGFRWVNGTMQALGKLPAPYGVCANGTACSIPAAVSGDGSVVVGTGFVVEPGASQHSYRPFVWSGGTMTELTPPCSPRKPGDWGEALGISSNGSTIVGYLSCEGANGQAFRHNGGNTALLGFLSGHNRSQANGVSADGSVVVGWSDNRNQYASHRAFRWSNSSMSDLGTVPDSTIAAANAISGDASTVVGGHLGPGGGAGDNRAVRWGGGRVTDFDGSHNGGAKAVSGNGSVVVRGGSRWTARAGAESITALLTKHGVDVSQWSNIGGYGMAAVSTNGVTFAGAGVDLNGKQQAWIARIPLPPVAHDFEGSAKSDIVWRDTSGNTAIWFMNGGAVAGSTGIGTADSNWQIAGQRDFDGDGKYDILWRHSSGVTAIWFMNGATIKSVVSLGTIPSEWSVVGTRDLNGDGKGDILWRNTAGNTAVWLMNGGTVSSTAAVGNVPPAWSIVTSDDFNADGKADILWRDTSGNTAIWFMNGAAVTSSATVATVAPPWEIVGTGDFDGDGRADLLWRDNAGNTAIWLMSGASIAVSAGIGNVPPAWSVAETGDFNGDGRADVLWRNTSTGDTAIWFMNGTSVASSATVANVPTTWTIEAKNAN
jgi:probable HAF family extracellular repeat protein